ncbi:MAG: response regulator [Chromatocurvus sp.]
MKLCLVEDDTALSAVLTEGLVAADYCVHQSYSGVDALRLLNSTSFDLAIIDIGLPDMSGIDVIRRLRRSGSAMPILILTARHSTDDRVLGLDAGADDYLAKPFDFDELLARLRAILRRASGALVNVLECGPVRLEPATQTATLADQPLQLARREFMLLRLLLENAGRIVTRDRLETELYGWLDPIGSNAIEVHVHHLRKKLGAQRIRTMRGVGYMLVRS